MACAMGQFLVFILVGSLCWQESVSSTLPYLEFKYHNHTELTNYLQHVNTTHPFITSLYSIGKSVRKRDLWVLEVTAAPKSRIGVPNVKLVGNIHGNEPVGNEVILHLIQFLISNYPSNETVAWLLNNTRIHFLPSMNPDGFRIAEEGNCRGELGRNNFKKFDLNRNFPDAFHENTHERQEEMLAVHKWMTTKLFVLSTGLHGGALLADYPYDNLGPHPWVAALNLLNKSMDEPNMKEIWRKVDHGTSEMRQESQTPDNDVFVHLASSYAKTHPTMHKGDPCKPLKRSFPGGFINGAKWFSSPGGMADYNYAYHGCLELTIEIGCCKYPNKEELPQYWEQNKEAMLEFIGQVHRGVKGVVVDSVTCAPIPGANLKIEGRNNTFRTSERGEFWRILLPGEYSLQVNADGYPSVTVPFTVKAPVDSKRPNATWLAVRLSTESPSVSESPTSTIALTQTTDMSTSADYNTSLPRDYTISTESTSIPAPQIPPSTSPPYVYASYRAIKLEENDTVTIRAALSSACRPIDHTTLVIGTLAYLAISLFM